MGLATFVGKRKKAAFLSLKDRFHKKVDGGILGLCLNDEGRCLSGQSFRLFQLIPWSIFYSQRLCVTIWRNLWGDFGGKKRVVRRGFIGVSGEVFAFLRSMGEWGFGDLLILTRCYWPSKVGGFLLPLILYYLKFLSQIFSAF